MTKFVFAIALLGLLATPALAQEAPEGPAREGRPQRGDRPGPKEHFEEMDTDKDGKVSKEEAKGRLLEKFDDIDADSDGFVTKEEARAFAEAHKEERGEKREGKREGRPGKRGEGRPGKRGGK